MTIDSTDVYQVSKMSKAQHYVKLLNPLPISCIAYVFSTFSCNVFVTLDHGSNSSFSLLTYISISYNITWHKYQLVNITLIFLNFHVRL